MLSLIHAVAGRPWAIRAEIAVHVRGLLAREGIGGLRHLAELKAAVHAFDGDDGHPRAASAARRTPQAYSTVAVIPVIGPVTQRVQAIGSAAVTRSTTDVAAEVRAAAVEPNVDAILLELDSPGGEVYGVPEAWASIRESGKMKPVVAIANSVAASAGLYLASAANEIWATPSGEVGSVGVYMLHVDASKALEKMGEAWDFIVATKSPYKVEGNPAAPLTDEARAYLQEDTDRYMAMFIRDLAAGRGKSERTVEADFGGGRMLSPTQAAKVGMVDRVGTFEQAMRRAAQLGQQWRENGAPPRRAEAPPPPPLADHEEIAARAALAGLPRQDGRNR